MIFLVLVPSPPYVAIRRRELLPRGFTLTLAGGLFSVTACIKLLPSVLSTAGRPFQSGLSSESSTQRKLFTPSRLWRQPRGACGLHYVQTGDLLSFRLFTKDTDPVATAGAVQVTVDSKSVRISDRSVLPIYVNELFLVSELALHLVILSIYLCNSLLKPRCYVFAMFVALH